MLTANVTGLHALYLAERLIDDDDFTRGELHQVLREAKRLEISVPPVLSDPGTTYEKFRGAWGNEEYHWLRRYRYSRWLIACAKKHGVDIAYEYSGLDGTVIQSKIEYDRWGMLKAIPWFELAAEPQIAEMAAVLKKNRAAEANKRSGSRAGKRAKELRAAGYEQRGYAGWFRGGKIEKDA